MKICPHISEYCAKPKWLLISFRRDAHIYSYFYIIILLNRRIRLILKIASNTCIFPILLFNAIAIFAHLLILSTVQDSDL